MQIPDIAQAIANDKARKIKRYPAYINRASSLGYSVPELKGCVRRGVFERSHWDQKELYNVGTQFIFDEGGNQEKQVYKDILEAGFEIIEQQTPYSWTKYQISGSIDGKLAIESEAGHAIIAIPVEIKSMSPNIYAVIHAFKDFMKYPWTRAYMAQITLYMLMQEINKGLFILKNKSTGQIKQIEVDLDYELGEACIRTAEQINEHIKNGTLPERIEDRTTCKNCPFKHVCLPNIDFGIGLQIADDPSLLSKIDRYMEIKDASKEADKLWKEEIAAKCKATAAGGDLNVMLGKYHLSGKTSTKGSFRTTVKLIGEEDGNV